MSMFWNDTRRKKKELRHELQARIEACRKNHSLDNIIAVWNFVDINADIVLSSLEGNVREV